MYTWFITYKCGGIRNVVTGKICESEVEARIDLCKYLTLHPCDAGRKVIALQIIYIEEPNGHDKGTCL
jgi:hypothetical protein